MMQAPLSQRPRMPQATPALNAWHTSLESMSGDSPDDLVSLLQGCPAHDPSPVDRYRLLRELVERGFDALPLPGRGATLQRWRMLATVAAHDLPLCKLYEGHTDALAIFAELGHDRPEQGGIWGMWAAEARHARVQIDPGFDGTTEVRLTGTKPWCSGAPGLTHGLMTVWRADGSGPWLAAVPLRQAGISMSTRQWNAVGMGPTQTADVILKGASARLVGGERAYLERPGFWHGGLGIAACWHGAAAAIGGWLLNSGLSAPTPFRLAALGKVDVLLAQSASLLQQSARWIDGHPEADARGLALRARAAAESAALQVLELVSRALGPAPMCQDARLARLMADLPVYLRQCHGEPDLAELGKHLAGRVSDVDGGDPWCL